MNQPSSHSGIERIMRSELFRKECYIGEDWVPADNGHQTTIYNPTNGEAIGTVPNCGAAETHRAIRAAELAFADWSKRTGKERAAILRRWYELILEEQDLLAELLTLEQGKPLNEALAEVRYGAAFVEWFAEEAKRLYGDVIPGHEKDKRILVFREPIGVVAAITPWNFPIAMITRKAAPALATGCTMVCKPAPQTPYSALALAALAERAGIPAGVFNVITGDAVEIGDALCDSPVVRKLTFTGSTKVGKLLMRQCADTLKKLSLELGGNAPFIVFEDADLDAAVQGVLASKFRNSGQTCVCANRILVHDEVHDAFVEKLVAAVSELVVGSGFDVDSQQGPLIDVAALAKVQELLGDALAQGAQLRLGGLPHSLGGTFFQPTVITDVTDTMLIAHEEIFGPIAPIFRFGRDEDAIAMANATEYGLAAYFYTNSLERAFRVSEQLQYGIVGLNTGIVSTELAPFGGVKASGFGREGSRYGILDYTELKYLCVGGMV
jgi:succinate-semialdehyde dehydrogenase / glutarate-semialdehyde dehydrogenase